MNILTFWYVDKNSVRYRTSYMKVVRQVKGNAIRGSESFTHLKCIQNNKEKNQEKVVWFSCNFSKH